MSHRSQPLERPAPHTGPAPPQGPRLDVATAVTSEGAPLGPDILRTLQRHWGDWSQGLGRAVQAEMERALLQGLAAAFRTLAEQLPRLLAGACPEQGPDAPEEPSPPEGPPQLALVTPPPEDAAADAPGPRLSDTRADLAAARTTELPVLAPGPAEQPSPEPPPEAAGRVADTGPTPREQRAARAHYRRGAKHSRAGDFRRGLAHLTEAIRLHPQYRAAYLARGQVLRLLGRLEQSADDLRAAIALDPADPFAHLWLGSTCLAQRRWPEAIAACTEAVRLDPGLAAAFLQRGLAQARHGQTARAIADAGEALKLNPDLVGAYLLRAASYVRQGRNDEAIADLSRVLRLEPGHAQAYNARGEAHSNKGEHERAIADYGRALSLDPDLLPARFNRALAQRHKGEYELAVTELTEVIGLCPTFPRVHFHRALAYLGAEQYDEALADLDRAVERDPDDREARARREQARQESAQRRALPAPPPAITPGWDPPREQEKADPTTLALRCPGCGAPAKINWRRLDRVFKCRKCARLARVNKDGRLAEWTPPASAPQRRGPPRRLLAAAAAVAAALAVAGWWYWGSDPDSGLPELPQDLQARGELWAKAWLEGDRFLLRRLTDPARDRQLHQWLERHRPPGGKGRPASRKGASRPTIRVLVKQTRTAQAVLTVRLTAPELRGPVELRLDWTKRANAWYFVPALRGST
jgi:tetratricopeptide (TPR) repeat protein